MELLIREYRDEDAAAVIGIFRDAYNTLRASKGGIHPDEEVEKTLAKPDRWILARLTSGCVLLVAEVSGSGELAGTAAIRSGLAYRFFKSTLSMNHYVKERFQRGRAGVSVGSLLRRASIEKARSMGFRKICGYSYPESKPFHARFGAVFFPAHDIRDPDSSVPVCYYEVEVRPSVWNRFRFEPHAVTLVRTCRKASRLASTLASRLACAGSRRRQTR